ncbi:hypothetical protein TSUD_256920 [Trifolium subterraneum]|uniref:Uncharacterized protein n=1 Tax=Trifolium subterraneum TaxID=3900 RepID=A0A2Z6M7D4_TRISU|nr:hypothetical protein TSUD_256920 [Trifolium subterraneum]
MKEKLVEDGNELGVLRKMVGGLENKVSELKKLNEKLVKDNNAFDELRGKVRVLEDEKNDLAVGFKIQIGELEEKVKNHLATISELREEYSKLADEKRKVVIVYKLLCTKFRDLQGRVSKLEDDCKHWMNGNASDGGNSEGEPRADHMVADFEDNGGNNEEEPWMNDVSDGGNDEGEPRADPASDFEENGEEDDTVEAGPLSRNEDAPHSLGVVASTHPQNIEGNGGQGASSGYQYLVQHVQLMVEPDHDEIALSSHQNAQLESDIIKNTTQLAPGPAEEAALDDKFMRRSPNFSLEDRDVLQKPPKLVVTLLELE